MSERRLQAGAAAAPAVVTDLDGKRVRIGGYVVPLDFEATTSRNSCSCRSSAPASTCRLRPPTRSST